MAQTDIELTITGRVEGIEKALKKTEEQLESLQQKQKKTTDSFSKGFKDALPDISKASVAMAGMGIAVAALQRGLSNMLAKESALAGFSAITGVAGAELEKFGEAAVELSNQFGTTAVDNIEAFKGVLSRLGPDFANSSEAVKLMGENINTLALASGLDATESMDALTTAMLQFGVDLSDPLKAAQEATDMMNIMAAGAKLGAAEVPQISEALRIAGATAHNAGMSFEELNAGLQVAAAAGITGAEAGTAFRNVLVRLQAPTKDAAEAMAKYGIDAKQVAQTISTKEGLTSTMELLRQKFAGIKDPAERAALLNKIYGESAQNLGTALMTNVGQFGELEAALIGTKTAQEQANTMLDTTEGKWNRFAAFIDNTLVKSLEAAKSFLGNIFGALEQIASLDLAKAGDSVTSAIRDIASYSTLGLSETALGWVGLGEESEKTAKKVEKSSKKIKAATPKAPDAPAASGKKSSGGKSAKKEAQDWQAILKDLQKTYGGLREGQEGFVGPGLMDGITIATAQVKTFEDSILSLSTVSADGVLTLQDDMSVMIGLYEGLAEAGTDAFQGMGAALMGEADAMKGVLKNLLNIVITYVEGLILASAAAASGKAVTSFGLSLITDAPLLAAAFAGLEIARGVVNSFEVGSPFIPRDQYARLHKGEAVLTADQNAERMKANGAVSAGSRVGPLKTTQTTIAVRPVMFDYSIDRNRMATARRAG